MKPESIEQLGEVVQRRVLSLNVARAKLKAAKKAYVASADDVKASGEALTICQGVAQTIQQKAHEGIASIVTRCLASVFDNPYEFKIVFEQKRSRTEARLIFVRDGREFHPMGAAGGGAVDVAAFALRLSCMMLSRKATRRVLVLDEPFRFVSARYRKRVRLMLETLATELGVQIIMVTHQKQLKAGTVITIQPTHEH